MSHWSNLFAFIILIIFQNVYAALPAKLNALELLTQKKLTLETAAALKKGNVFIFMSAKCPCSDSHVPLIKKLVAQYPDFEFYAVHSNLDEDAKTTQEYFKKQNLPLKLIQDTNTQIADTFQAYKTPHAFVIGKNREILYQGGVTNSSHADRADRFYLRDALEDLHSNREVRTAEGRTLGCVIMRKHELTQ